ncbi:OLC1v1005051C1 [Oldenlandia corymbosa var. corymbosa]|uniref:OLC1v1005051C1 n=1 Tax=Oldenlandia corymbosa var. corymbosa TaxID=529605 RepID=A0AAV1DGG1_OLDCO|nr:OLC1v1005051C1 [Oldenlandia corymbosa var. corymbosa]
MSQFHLSPIAKNKAQSHLGLELVLVVAAIASCHRHNCFGGLAVVTPSYVLVCVAGSLQHPWTYFGVAALDAPIVLQIPNYGSVVVALYQGYRSGGMIIPSREHTFVDVAVCDGYKSIHPFSFKLFVGSNLFTSNPSFGVALPFIGETAKMSKRGCGGSANNKFRMSLGLPVAATVNCADDIGVKNLYIILVKGMKGRLNRLPSDCVGDMVMATVKNGKPDLSQEEGHAHSHCPPAQAMAPTGRCLHVL